MDGRGREWPGNLGSAPHGSGSHGPGGAKESAIDVLARELGGWQGSAGSSNEAASPPTHPAGMGDQQWADFSSSGCSDGGSSRGRPSAQYNPSQATSFASSAATPKSATRIDSNSSQGRRRGGSMGDPAWLSARSASAASKISPALVPVEVDGLSAAEVEQLFAASNTQGSGLLAAGDARAFFKRTGLSTKALSRIWNTVKAASAETQEGLNIRQFSMALRLVALAQMGEDLLDERARAAMEPHVWQARGHPPLPTPRLSGARDARSSLETSEPARPDTTSLQRQALSPASSTGGPESDALPCPIPEQQAQPLAYVAPVACDLPTQLSGLEAPVCVDARLPPLHPKACASLALLAAGHGSLFAGPSARGGVLQWSRSEGDLRHPEASDDSSTGSFRRAEKEDLDSTACAEVFLPDAKQVTCMHVDEARALLWVGHADGKVSGFAMGPAVGAPINTRRIHHFQAYKGGKVTAICTTAHGDVWVGSSKGYLRVWRAELIGPGIGRLSQPRELRRQGGGRAAGHAIRFLVVPQCGQVVWCGSLKTLHLWDVATGTYLGQLQRGGDGEGSLELHRRFLDNSERDPRFVPRLPINSSKGLELDSSSCAILCPAASCRREVLLADQEAWAAQTDRKLAAEWVENVGAFSGRTGKAAGKAAKHAGKFIGKLVKNMKDEARQRGVGGSSKALEPEPILDAPGIDGEASEPGEEGLVGHDGELRALAADGADCVWAAWASGKVERFSFNGQWQLSKDMCGKVTCLAAVGPRLWAGMADGRIRVVADKAVTREFRAHDAGILRITPAGSRVYSLAADGSVRGWCSTIPSEQDQASRQALHNAAASLMEHRRLEMLCLTWNVNEQKPQQSIFFERVSELAAGTQLAVFGLEEIEMGGGSVALAAAKDAVYRKAQEKGNTNAQWWALQLLVALGGPTQWRQCGLRQLSGMLVVVFARSEFEDSIGDVSTASVACGVLGVGGNKGAVAVSFTLFRRRIACVCSHFAAHQDAVWTRNQNYLAISRGLTFSKLPWVDTQVYLDEDQHVHKSLHHISEQTVEGSQDGDAGSDVWESDMIQGQGMRSAELLVWLGDFNYRIGCTYTEAKERIRNNQLDYLLEQDQCRNEMREGKIFRQLREAPIHFPPTYKFNKNDPSPLAYDSSEKRRVPAWTDRVFFRGTLRSNGQEEDANGSLIDGMDGEDQSKAVKAESVMVDALEYDAAMEVCDSDHKPVWARLLVTLPVTRQAEKRRLCSSLLAECYSRSAPEPPRVEISPGTLQLHPIDRQSVALMVRNTGSSPAVVRLAPLEDTCWQPQETEVPASPPDWLQVFPISCRIPPQASRTIWVSLTTGESTWVTVEKQALLRLRVDHEYVAGGERPKGSKSRDKHVLVLCSTQSQE